MQVKGRVLKKLLFLTTSIHPLENGQGVCPTETEHDLLPNKFCPSEIIIFRIPFTHASVWCNQFDLISISHYIEEQIPGNLWVCGWRYFLLMSENPNLFQSSVFPIISTLKICLCFTGPHRSNAEYERSFSFSLKASSHPKIYRGVTNWIPVETSSNEVLPVSREDFQNTIHSVLWCEEQFALKCIR